ncbi:MAG TPA: helix-turn-helix domain-containing protein [Gemmatimonadales bacterium]|nr:helix-turn-helix domain-containing protein [Gemmatimonadales bacterium]
MTRETHPASLAEPRSDCPIAASLDLIGDRWTLLIVRDLFRGKRRFSEFLASAEGIKTNILAQRLKRLEEAGLLERSPYQKHPPRYDYHLTSQGRDLSPVLTAIYGWGRAYFPNLRS